MDGRKEGRKEGRRKEGRKQGSKGAREQGSKGARKQGLFTRIAELTLGALHPEARSASAYHSSTPTLSLSHKSKKGITFGRVIWVGVKDFKDLEVQHIYRFSSSRPHGFNTKPRKSKARHPKP